MLAAPTDGAPELSMTTPPPLPPRPTTLPPTPASTPAPTPVPWWRRMGAQAITALALAGTFVAVKVGPPIFGYVFGRSAISVIAGVKNRADPKYRAVGQAFRDAGLDPDSTLRSLGKQVDFTWFRSQGALRSGTHLAGAELRELLAFRENMLAALPVSVCAAWVEGRPDAGGAIQVIYR